MILSFTLQHKVLLEIMIDNRHDTSYLITEHGCRAFDAHVSALAALLNLEK